MSDRDNNNFWLFLEVLANYRTFIIFTATLLTTLTVAIVWNLPKEYTAEGLLLPPSESSSIIINTGDYEKRLTKLDMGPLTGTTDIFVRILESRTVSDKIINDFNLIEHYDKVRLSDAYHKLMDRAYITKTREDLLEISVTDRSAEMSANLVNAFIDELHNVYKSIVAEKANEKITFYTSKLDELQSELQQVKQEFIDFQLEHKTIDFNQQTKLVMEQAIELKVKLAEINMNISLSNDGSNLSKSDLTNPKKSINLQLSELEKGGGTSSFFNLPLDKIPLLKREYEALFTKVKVKEAISALLLERVEQAKIQSQGTVPEFSVLQRAKVPDIHSFPHKSKVLIIGFICSLFLSVLLASFLNYFNKLQSESPENYLRARSFLDAYMGWIPGVKKNKKSEESQ